MSEPTERDRWARLSEYQVVALTMLQWSKDACSAPLDQQPNLTERLAQMLAQARAEEREAIATQVIERLGWYPLTTFPEPPAGEHGQTVDACSARAARYVLLSLHRWLEARGREGA